MQSRCITTDGSGNIISIATAKGTVDLDPGVGVFEVYSLESQTRITKLNADGDFIWGKHINGINHNVTYGVVTDNSNNIYLTGHFQGVADFDPGPDTYDVTATGFLNAFILKLNENGEFLWVKTIESTDVVHVVHAFQLRVDGENNILIGGVLDAGIFDLDPGPGTYEMTGDNDGFILKLNETGEFVWAKKFTNEFDYVYVEDFEVDASGNIYVTGVFEGTTNFNTDGGTDMLTAIGGGDVFLCKLTSSGSLIWAKQIGGLSTELLTGIDLDESGGSNSVLLTGSFSTTTDFDPSAATANLVSEGLNDIFVGKYSSDGALLWAKGFGGTGSDSGSNIRVNSNGFVYATGSFANTVDFDSGPETAILTSAGSLDGVLIRLTKDGDFSTVYQFAGLGVSTVQDVAIDPWNNVVITGAFNETLDTDPSPGVSNFTADVYDVFITRLELLDAGTKEGDAGTFNNLTLYPNPAATFITIQTDEQVETISIFNAAGQLLQTETTNAFSIESLASGFYIVSVKTAAGMAKIRLVKE